MSHSDPFTPVGRYLSGAHLCGYSPTDTPQGTCNTPAMWHVLWTVDGDAGMACPAHMELALRRLVFMDRHQLAPDCGMPDAAWGPKGCAVPDGEPTPESASRLTDPLMRSHDFTV